MMDNYMSDDSHHEPDDNQNIIVDDEVDFLKLARDAYHGSELYVNAHLRKEWESGIRQFQSKHSSASKYNSDSYDGKSKLFRPRTRAAIRKNEASAAAAFFSTNDVVNISPVDENSVLDNISSEIISGLVNYRLRNSIPWFMLLIGAYQDVQVYGQVVSYQSWTYGDGDDKPSIEIRPIENIRISPAAEWTDPINTSPYLIDLIPMYICDIKLKMDTIDEKTGSSIWMKASESMLLAASSEYYDSTRITREDRNDSKANQYSSNNDFSTAWIRRNIIKHEGVDWIFYTLGSEHLLSEPQRLAELYQNGKRPYVMGYAILETNKIYPSSICNLTREVQQEINSIANQRIDNVKFAVNKRFFIKRGAQVDMQSLNRNRPGSSTLMNDPNNDVKVLNTPDVTSSAFQEQDRLNLEFDDLAGTFSGSSVQGNRKLNETVGGMNIMAQGANQLGEYQLRTFVETWVEPVIKQLVDLEIQYETDAKILSIAVKKSDTFDREGFEQFEPRMLDGDITVDVNVGTGATNPQSQVERFFYGMNSLSGMLGQEFINTINKKEVISEVFGKLGYKDGARFFESNDEVDPMIAKYEQQIEELTSLLNQKVNPEEQAAKIKKILAETENIKGDTVNKSIESILGAISASEKALLAPGTVGLAGGLLGSSGYDDKNGYPIADVSNLDTSVMPASDPQLNTNPTTPMNPDVGLNVGMKNV